MTAFPDGFLWGTATAGHQVEGNNTNTDLWVIEHAPGTIFREPSGDACDHYRLYRQDLTTLKELGFNSVRFSIEWARVEPEDGCFSKAALRHYGDVLQTCHELGLTPLVTLHHFASPRWLMRHGGWMGAETPARFAAYARTVMEELGSMMPFVATINEANIPSLIRLMNLTNQAEGDGGVQAPVGVQAESPDSHMFSGGWVAASAAEIGTSPENFHPFLFAEGEQGQATVMKAHALAVEAIKAVCPDTRVGITLAVPDFQAAPGGEDLTARMQQEVFGSYLPALRGDDYIGVQAYTRIRVGPYGPLPTEEGAKMTQMGYEYYPEALEGALRLAASAGLPMIVTENGLGTEDDSERVEFVGRALSSLQRAIADGIDVRGYMYWSAMDNWEWMLGYEPKFGLLSVDHDTQERRVKDSGRYLGAIARANALTTP